MKKTNLTAVILLSLTTAAATHAVASNGLIEFQSGGYIKASEMNQNFETLASMVEASGVGNNVMVYNVDCSTEDTALKDFMTQRAYSDTFMVVELQGNCSWSDFDINRDSIMFQGGTITVPVDNSGSNGAITIRMKNIGFSNTVVEGSFHYDNGGGWLDNVEHTGQIIVDGGGNLAIAGGSQGGDLTVQSNSRVWLNGSSRDFNELYVLNNSSLNAGDGFTLTSGYIKLSNGGYMGVDNIQSLTELDVRRGSHISSEGELRASEISIRENSTVLTGGVTSDNVDVRSGANLNVSNDNDDAILNVGYDLLVKGGASVIGNKLQVKNLNAVLGSSVHFDDIRGENLDSFANGAVAADYILMTDTANAERGGVIVSDGDLDATNVVIMGGQVEARRLIFNDIRMWEFGNLMIGSEGGLNEALEHLCNDYEFEGQVNAPMGNIDGLESSTNFPSSCSQFFN